ncbi:MAG: hypothetical protein Q9219_001774 [cf. Caloplaca sp. 3 TL-2023]
MVLETSETSDPDDALPESPDLYNDSQPFAQRTSVDISRYPKPIPIFGSLIGFSRQSMLKDVETRIKDHSSVLRRPLTQPETEAVMFYTYKSMSAKSYGYATVVGFGAYRAYKTQDTYRFPFYGPMKTTDGWWDGERVRIMGVDVMKGLRARLLVNAVRGSAYGYMAYFLGGLVVDSYATTVAAVGELRDPRLKDYWQALRKQSEERGKTIGTFGATNQPKDPLGQGSISAPDLWKRHRTAIGADDDASPSAGSEYDSGDLGGPEATNTGIMSDAQMQSQEARQQASPRGSPTENRASTFELGKVEKQPMGFGEAFDDASPTAPGDADHNQSGNAWDRIRRQAQQRNSGSAKGSRGWDSVRGEQQTGSTTGDSFTFSSAEQERQLARDEAQREFDAKVERERQGGNFNEKRGTG